MKAKMSSIYKNKLVSGIFQDYLQLTASLGPKNEKGNDELNQHPNNDRVPLHSTSVVGRGPHSEDDDAQAEETHCSVRTSVVLTFRAHKCANHHNCNNDKRTKWGPELFWNQARYPGARASPHKTHWL